MNEVCKPPLPRYSDLGSYPLIYLQSGHTVLCHDCATEAGLGVEHAHAHWEGPALECDECSIEIESAYGDPDDPNDG